MGATANDSELVRCSWVDLSNPEYVRYHDEEWGRPVTDDQQHFEMLSLEGAQAGLSWATILKKREGYRELFQQFDPEKVADLSDAYLEELLLNPRIVRHKGKIASVRTNARCFLEIQEEYGSFDSFVRTVLGDTVGTRHKWKELSECHSFTPASTSLSKVLKKRGFAFVGPTTVYSYMQASGLVNDHMCGCNFSGDQAG